MKLNQDRQASLSEMVPDINTATCLKGTRQEKGMELLQLFKKKRFIPVTTLKLLSKQYHCLILDLRRGQIDGQQYDIVTDNPDGVGGFRFRGKY